MYVRRPWTIRQYAGFSTAERNTFIDVILPGQKDYPSLSICRHTVVMIQITRRVVGDVGKQELPLTL
jgi:methylmalonyl-CoA mutase N-terminal domain/subunit